MFTKLLTDVNKSCIVPIYSLVLKEELTSQSLRSYQTMKKMFMEQQNGKTGTNRLIYMLQLHTLL